ncbi:MAG: SH3 domain-containing protein [Clostridia bacterium]|nr:SH3 domain-containing protein [Clostridia bacterium]
MKQTGFFKRIATVALLIAMVLSAVPTAGSEVQHGYVVLPSNVSERVVNFRKEANTNDNTNYPIARLPEYWVVEILGRKSTGTTDWYYVRTNIGVAEGDKVQYSYGFVMAKYIQAMTDSEEALYRQNQGNTFIPAAPVQVFDADPEGEDNIPIGSFSDSDTMLTVEKEPIGYVRVSKSGVNLRDKPGGTSIDVLMEGTFLPYYEAIAAGKYDAYAWVLVVHNGIAGYVRSDCFIRVDQYGNAITANSYTGGASSVQTVTYATAAQYVTTAPTAYVEPVLVAGQTVGMVTRDNVFFRKDMSTAGDFWARLPYGWTMTVLAKETRGKTTWYKVKGGTPENPNRTYTGYIHSDYFILLNSTATATPVPWYVPTGLPTAAPTGAPQGDSNYGLVLVDGLNMRQTPGGTTVSVLRVNTVVSILTKPAGNTANDWYFVKYNGVMGYLPATGMRVLNIYELPNYTLPDGQVVTASPTPEGGGTVPAGAKGYVKTIKDKVNIRKTAGGDILTATDKSKIPVGKVLAYYDGPTALIGGYTWVLVTYNGVSGYIRSDCFTYCDQKGDPVATPTPAPGTVTASPYNPDGSQGYIKLLKGGVNLRATAGGATIAQLAKDTVLPYFNIVRTGNNSLETWYEVYSAQKGVFGYILSTMAQQCDAQGNPITPVLPTGSPEIGYVATSVSGVWLRATPYADGDIVGQVKQKGTVLPQIGAVVRNGYDWYPVRTADGKQGYLRGDCVFALAQWQIEEYQKTGKVSTPTPGPATPRPGNSSYIMTTSDKVYIRQSPSTKAAAIGQAPLGTVLKYSATQTVGLGTTSQVTWYQVAYSGQIGWMHGSYVRVLTNAEYDALNATATPKPGTTAVPTTAPDLTNLSDLAITTVSKVNIRASASMSGRDIAMVDAAGTELAYLGEYVVPDKAKNNDYYWFKIRYGKVTGWMRGDCVHVLTETEKAQRKLNPSYTVSPTGYRTLYKSSTGEDVYQLQYKLYQLGYLAYDQVNGTYLATTEAAVAAFQRAKGLTVDGIAGIQTQQTLFSTNGSTVTAAPNNNGTNGQYVNGSSTTVTLYPVEKSDWFTGDIQEVWPNGSVAILTDVYTGISFKAQRLYGGNHADCEPVDTADTAAICAIYGVSRPQEIEDREQELQSYRRRPTWVTVGGRTFCASVYGIPHNYSGDRIANNGYTGQFCVHFTNSRTHTSNIVDPDASYNNYFGAQSAIQYAYEHSISGWK